MTNENCLEGIKCPACGNEDVFRIGVTTTAIVTDDGAEVEHGEMEWDKDSHAECANCLERGKLSHFTPTRRARRRACAFIARARGEQPPVGYVSA